MVADNNQQFGVSVWMQHHCSSPHEPRRYRAEICSKGAAYAIGAVGLSIAGTGSAEAAAGTMFYGANNFAGDSYTSLLSSHSQATLEV